MGSLFTFKAYNVSPVYAFLVFRVGDERVDVILMFFMYELTFSADSPCSVYLLNFHILTRTCLGEVLIWSRLFAVLDSSCVWMSLDLGNSQITIPLNRGTTMNMYRGKLCDKAICDVVCKQSCGPRRSHSANTLILDL